MWKYDISEKKSHEIREALILRRENAKQQVEEVDTVS
jgi:hypothetical protein